jgi:hypothetical protein
MKYGLWIMIRAEEAAGGIKKAAKRMFSGLNGNFK